VKRNQIWRGVSPWEEHTSDISKLAGSLIHSGVVVFVEAPAIRRVSTANIWLNRVAMCKLVDPRSFLDSIGTPISSRSRMIWQYPYCAAQNRRGRPICLTKISGSWVWCSHVDSRRGRMGSVWFFLAGAVGGRHGIFKTRHREQGARWFNLFQLQFFLYMSE